MVYIILKSVTNFHLLKKSFKLYQGEQWEGTPKRAHPIGLLNSVQ